MQFFPETADPSNGSVMGLLMGLPGYPFESFKPVPVSKLGLIDFRPDLQGF